MDYQSKALILLSQYSLGITALSYFPFQPVNYFISALHLPNFSSILFDRQFELLKPSNISIILFFISLEFHFEIFNLPLISVLDFFSFSFIAAELPLDLFNLLILDGLDGGQLDRELLDLN